MALFRFIALGVFLFQTTTSVAAVRVFSDIRYWTATPASSEALEDRRFHNLDVYMPSQSNRNHAAIVLIHGGGFVGGDKTDATYVKTAKDLATRGYTVFSVNYRVALIRNGGTLGPHGDFPFPAAIDDVEEAVRWIRANSAKYKIDSTKIAAMGHSAGGNLSAMLGVSKDSAAKVQAVVSFSGYLDLRYEHPVPASEYRPYYLPYKKLINRVCLTEAECIARDDADSVCSLEINKKRNAGWPGRCALYAMASPPALVDKDSSPMIVFHGLADERVPPEHSRNLRDSLKANGIYTALYEVTGVGHVWEPFKVAKFGATKTSGWVITLNFLKKYLAL